MIHTKPGFRRLAPLVLASLLASGLLAAAARADAATGSPRDIAYPGTIELLIRRDDLYQTVRIDYRDGLRYPRLARIESTPDRLGAILKPRT